VKVFDKKVHENIAIVFSNYDVHTDRLIDMAKQVDILLKFSFRHHQTSRNIISDWLGSCFLIYTFGVY